jgi:hypothetical protein
MINPIMHRSPCLRLEVRLLESLDYESVWLTLFYAHIGLPCLRRVVRLHPQIHPPDVILSFNPILHRSPCLRLEVRLTMPLLTWEQWTMNPFG